MGVGEACGGDHHGACGRLEFPFLVQEFRFSPFVDIVQIEHEQQDAMESLGGGIARVDFGVPIVIATDLPGVFLDIDGPGAEDFEQVRTELLLRGSLNIGCRQRPDLSSHRILDAQRKSAGHQIRILAQVEHQMAQSAIEYFAVQVVPVGEAGDGQIGTVLFGFVDTVAGESIRLAFAGFESIDDLPAQLGRKGVVVDFDKVSRHSRFLAQDRMF